MSRKARRPKGTPFSISGRSRCIRYAATWLGLNPCISRCRKDREPRRPAPGSRVRFSSQPSIHAPWPWRGELFSSSLWCEQHVLEPRSGRLSHSPVRGSAARDCPCDTLQPAAGTAYLHVGFHDLSPFVLVFSLNIDYFLIKNYLWIIVCPHNHSRQRLLAESGCLAPRCAGSFGSRGSGTSRFGNR